MRFLEWITIILLLFGWAGLIIPAKILYHGDPIRHSGMDRIRIFPKRTFPSEMRINP
jgi:hypothetical protein